MQPSPETRYAAAVELWREWNAKINVISRKDTDAIYAHHILHSLAIAEYFSRFHGGGMAPGGTVLDLGTGGGFPGIPLPGACHPRDPRAGAHGLPLHLCA